MSTVASPWAGTVTSSAPTVNRPAGAGLPSPAVNSVVSDSVIGSSVTLMNRTWSVTGECG